MSRFHHSFHEVPTILIQFFVMMEDLYNQFIQTHSVLSITIVDEPENAQFCNPMDCRFGRSNHSSIQCHINTSNDKGAMIEIIGSYIYRSNL